MTDPIKSIKVHALITGGLLLIGGGATWWYARSSAQHENEFLQFYAQHRIAPGGITEDRVRAIVHEDLKLSEARFDRLEQLILDNRTHPSGGAGRSQPGPVPNAAKPRAQAK